MASSTLSNQLSALENQSNAQHRSEAYTTLLQQLLTNTTDPTTLSTNLTAYVSSILSESIGVINSRPLLTDFLTHYGALTNPEVKITTGNEIVALLAPKIISYEPQDTSLKFILADAYEAEEDFSASAQTLQTIVLDSSQRNVSDDEKAKVWMRICRCYLEEDDPTNALSYLNKIKNVIFNVKDTATRLQFQLSQARISDSQRNFLDASTSYLALSSEQMIDEEERLQALSAAITAAVLAPAGPPRARQLGKLYKDDRSASTPEYAILSNIFLDRLLLPTEVAAFASGLKEHQLAKTSDGSTVLEKAVLEHNILAASRLYQNISTAALGKLLGVGEERAERQCAAMIESARLRGVIDQIEGVVYFSPTPAAASGGAMGADGGVGDAGAGAAGKISAAGGVDAEALGRRVWDEGVQGLAEEVEKVATLLQVVEGGWYEEQMRVLEAKA